MRLCVHCNMRRHIEWTASSVPFIWYHKIFIENFNPCASSSSNIAMVQHRRSTTNAPCQCHTTMQHTSYVVLHLNRTYSNRTRLPAPGSRLSFHFIFGWIYLRRSCFRRELMCGCECMCDESVFRAFESTFVYLPFFSSLSSSFHAALVVGSTHAQIFGEFRINCYR